jgi:hypothetical protein
MAHACHFQKKAAGIRRGQSFHLGQQGGGIEGFTAGKVVE